MEHEVERNVPGDHPSLAGHFPGSPIVPAVVILEEVADALCGWRSGGRLRGIETVKFLRPLLPGRSFFIKLRDLSPETVGFVCRADDAVVAEGRLQIDYLG